MNDVNLPGLIVPIEARIDKLEKGFQRANRAQRRSAASMERRARSSADRIGATYAKMGQKMAGAFTRASAPLVAGLGSAATAKALFNTTKSIAQIGDEAKRAGVSAKAFQEWKFVAEQNRIGIDAMVDGLKELNLRADEFIVSGKGPAAEAFTRLGYGADALKDKLKDPSELLLEIMGRMRRLDVAARIRVADELFGGSAGERFVELVDRGEDGLRQTVQRAHELGLVLGDDVIERADEVSRKFDELSARVSTFGKRVAVSIADGIAEVADLRDKLDEIFENEGHGRLVLGDQIYDAMAANRDLLDEQSSSVRNLKNEYDQLADVAYSNSTQLFHSSQLAQSWGYDEAANQMSKLAEQLLALRHGFYEGEITGEAFAEKLSKIQTSANKAFDQLDQSDRVDFSSAIAEVARLGRVIGEVISRASAMRLELTEASGIQISTPEQQFANAEMESRRRWAEEQKQLNDFLQAEDQRNAMSRERLTLEREIAAVIRRAKEDGVTLSRSQAEDAAQAKIDADNSRNRSNSNGRSPQIGDFARAVQTIKERSVALNLEAAAVAASSVAGQDYRMSLEAARTEAELLNAAQMQGLPITSELRREVRGLARGYAEAASSSEQAIQKFEEMSQAREAFTNSAADAFAGVVTGTMTLQQALAGLAQQLAQMAAKKLFLSIFGSAFGGLGGLVGGIGFAQGGYTGDGGKFTPAGVVHKGEFVISKEATRRIGVGNLEALHSAAKRGYANGGLVGGASPLASAIKPPSPVNAAPAEIKIHAPVTVNGSAGSPEENNDLAKRMAREMEATMRGVVVQEIRNQQRPGNSLNNRRR